MTSNNTSQATPMRDFIDRLFDPTFHPWIKTLGGFMGWLWGTANLSTFVLLATLAWTVVNLFFLVRDKYVRDPRRLERLRRKNRMR